MVIIPARPISDPALVPALDRMREQMFGIDPYEPASPEEFRSAIEDAGSRLIIHMDRAIDAVPEVSNEAAVDAPKRKRRKRRKDAPADVPLATSLRLSEPMKTKRASIANNLSAALGGETGLRVVLMGRTTAGKSTVLEALTGGDGARRGDGRQRYTRDVEERPVTALPGVVLVDTPGVGAADGAEDFEMAFAQVPRADIVLWVASSEPTHEDTAKALRLLALYGKPIIILMNCRLDLEHPVHYHDFLANPDVTLHHGLEFVRAVEGPLAHVGVRLPTAVAVHAEAAFRGSRGGPDSEQLHRCSNVDALLGALNAELADNAEQRRLLRSFDALRTPAGEFLRELIRARRALAAVVRREEGITADLGKRLGRAVDERAEKLEAELARIVDARRSWHRSKAADPEGNVEKAWDREAEKLSQEVKSTIRATHKDTAKALQDISARVASDWSGLPLDEMGLDDLPDFDLVWLNRTVRAAVDVTAAATGAAVGMMIGGPVGLVVGGVVGLVLGELAGPVKGLLERIWKGKDRIMKERQETIEKKLRKMLNDADAQVRDHAKHFGERFHEELGAQIQRREVNTAVESEVLKIWDETWDDLMRELGSLDRSTAEALLRSCGRGRAADSVQRASRSPGTAIAMELSEPAFTEHVLFPPVGAVENLAAYSSRHAAGGAAAATSLLASVTPGSFAVRELSQRSARFSLLEDDPPMGLIRTWEELMSSFTKSKVAIELHLPAVAPWKE